MERPGPATVADAVAVALRSMIGSGELAPGDDIVIEHMAQRLGVSTQPVREALKVLEGEGRLEHQAHRGVRVVALTRDELDEVYRLRGLLEDEAIRRSVAEFPSMAVDELAGLVEAMAAASAAGDIDAVQSANREFHRLLRSFNPITRLDEQVVELRAVSAPYRRRFLEHRDQWPRLIADHWDIVAGVRAGDPEAVMAAVHRQRSITVRTLIDGDELP